MTHKLEKEQTWRVELSEWLRQQKDTHQRGLRAEKKFHAEKVSKDQELIQGLWDEQDFLCQELQGLKTKLKELASTNVELATELQAEEEVSQVLLQKKTAQLKEEQKEQGEEC